MSPAHLVNVHSVESFITDDASLPVWVPAVPRWILPQLRAPVDRLRKSHRRLHDTVVSVELFSIFILTQFYLREKMNKK